jgi:hypothetical protein
VKVERGFEVSLRTSGEIVMQSLNFMLQVNRRWIWVFGIDVAPAVLVFVQTSVLVEAKEFAILLK